VKNSPEHEQAVPKNEVGSPKQNLSGSPTQIAQSKSRQNAAPRRFITKLKIDRSISSHERQPRRVFIDLESLSQPPSLQPQLTVLTTFTNSALDTGR
jgi:hypothetical protein